MLPLCGLNKLIIRHRLCSLLYCFFVANCSFVCFVVLIFALLTFLVLLGALCYKVFVVESSHRSARYFNLFLLCCAVSCLFVVLLVY